MRVVFFSNALASDDAPWPLILFLLRSRVGSAMFCSHSPSFQSFMELIEGVGLKNLEGGKGNIEMEKEKEDEHEEQAEDKYIEEKSSGN